MLYKLGGMSLKYALILISIVVIIYVNFPEDDKQERRLEEICTARVTQMISDGKIATTADKVMWLNAKEIVKHNNKNYVMCSLEVNDGAINHYQVTFVFDEFLENMQGIISGGEKYSPKSKYPFHFSALGYDPRNGGTVLELSDDGTKYNFVTP